MTALPARGRSRSATGSLTGLVTLAMLAGVPLDALCAGACAILWMVGPS